MLNIERRSRSLCGHSWLALLGKVDGWGCCSTVCWLGFVHLTQRGPSGRKHFGIQKHHHARDFICMSPKQMSRKKWPDRARGAQELAFFKQLGTSCDKVTFKKSLACLCRTMPVWLVLHFATNKFPFAPNVSSSYSPVLWGVENRNPLAQMAVHPLFSYIRFVF